MKIKQRFNGIKSTISKHTRIELGLVLAVIGTFAWPVYRAIAKIESHEIRINRNEQDIKKIDLIAEDVNIIKGWVQAQPKK